MEPIPISKIILYPRPHVDNIAALFLLREFGLAAFPGIETAALEFWPVVPPGKTPDEYEAEGVLFVDLGGGRFDHHHDEHQPNVAKTTAAQLVAEHLGLADQPVLKRLLEFVRRDDVEGRGIISKDPLDRAFGLPAIIMNLNRNYPKNPEFVVDLVTRIFQSWYAEEYRRKVLMPQEWAELQANGRAQKIHIPTSVRPLTVVAIESDSPTMVGFLRAVGDVQADIVIQRMSSGHTNIVTKQDRDRTMAKLNIGPLVSAVRSAEAAKKGLALPADVDLAKPGRIEGLEEWYFDTAANTLQNGGAASQGISPTHLSISELVELLPMALADAVPAERPRNDRRSQTGPQVLRFSDLRRQPPVGPAA